MDRLHVSHRFRFDGGSSHRSRRSRHSGARFRRSQTFRLHFVLNRFEKLLRAEIAGIDFECFAGALASRG
jgi:hypothetical protein